MKILYTLISTLLSIGMLMQNALAQPDGADINTSYYLDTDADITTSSSSGTTYTHTASNHPSNGYGNDYGHSSDDIYYRFTLSSYGEVSISLCASGFDTYLHLLDASGNLVASNDDNGPLCSGTRSSIKRNLNAGTYYVVSEGYGSYYGDITTAVTIPNNLPLGAKLNNPILAGNNGTLSSGSSYTDTKSNATNQGYGNDYGQSSDDIYYRFTLNAQAEVNISLCASGFDTYLHLLDASGNLVASNDDNGPLCTGTRSSIKRNLNAGTYYVVAEGYGGNSGSITTSISVVSNNVVPVGATLSNPILAGNNGILSPGSPYTDTKSNATNQGYGNDYGQSSDDIYYRFILNAQAEVNISLCASDFDTYLHLLDASGNLVASNDDNGPLCTGTRSSIERNLNAGTYYVVAEGYGSNSGSITTSISVVSSPKTYTEFVNHELRHIDQSMITSGILYDRVVPLAGLHEFNQAAPDTSANRHFMQAYSELRSAATDTTSWLVPEHLAAMAEGKRLSGQIPIGLGNYAYHMIDTNAISLNLLYFSADSVLYDKPGRSRHPFNLMTNLIVAPLADSVPKHSTYYIGNEFLMQHSHKSISSLQIDFGNGGGLQSVSMGSNIAVNYPTTGFKFLKFVAHFSDGSNRSTYAVVKCYDPAPGSTLSQGNNAQLSSGSCGPITRLISAKIAFQGYNESSPSYGRGHVTTYYATNGSCDEVIRKPIIVIDGFDPGNERNAKDIYNKQLNKEISERTTPFADSLRSVGHDVIILNFPTYTSLEQATPILRDGGADYIERNAMVLVALIDSVNRVKQGNEKLIIIGPSMGGLISRYALAYMEQNNMPHHTKLWVSFDSPHKGANIPIGDQRFLEFFSGMSAAAKENLHKKIGSVAAKQMLLHHHTATLISPAAHPFRTQFMNNLNQWGFPQGDPGQPFRKVAIVNGSLGGNEINAPCQKGFTFDVRQIKTRLFFFKVKIKTFTLASAKMYFSPSYGNSCQVLEAKDPFKFWVYFSNSSSASSGYDVAPGGFFDTQRVLQQEGEGIIGTESSHTIAGKILNLFTGGVFNLSSKFYSVLPLHSFINTKSALAFTGSNQNLSENLKGRNLVCTNETPFDSYFGSFTENSEHVSLSNEIITWISGEIAGLPQAPSVEYVAAYSISGPSEICTTATYSISDLPSGTTVTWSVTGSANIEGTNTGTSVTLRKPYSNYGGHNKSINLTASIMTNCGTFTIHRTIKPIPEGLGVPIFINDENVDNEEVGGVPTAWISSEYDQIAYISPSLPSGTYYDWHLFPSGQIWSGQGSDRISFSVNEDGEYGLHCKATTPCGVNEYYVKLIAGDAYGGYYSYSAYPNPSNEELIVERQETTAANESVPQPYPSAKQATAADKSSKKNIPFEASLYNRKGEAVAHGKGVYKIRLNTSGLPNGTYFLHYKNEKGKLIKQQIIIRH